ncbi:MAG: hypothetical protein J6D47_16180 [Peptostreptococcaceae bacterium]|nr:hypothetical protein [Peptostreptococcaceae bacterium]MBP3931086.1 hypothetical protein [Peptostreptococcaceae bacterium]
MTNIVKELAIAKIEGAIYNECYNQQFNTFVFKVNGKQFQLKLNSDEYDTYRALVEIYNCKKEKSVF